MKCAGIQQLVQGALSRKENTSANVVAGASRRKEQVNCVQSTKGNEDEAVHLIYALNKWRCK